MQCSCRSSATAGEYTLIDTAGVRRRARVEEAVEKFSVIKALQAIDAANVVIGVHRCARTVAEQDATLFGMVAERGRALHRSRSTSGTTFRTDKRDEIRDRLDLRLRSSISRRCISSRRCTAPASAS